jgi:hypothetical protein
VRAVSNTRAAAAADLHQNFQDEESQSQPLDLDRDEKEQEDQTLREGHGVRGENAYDCARSAEYGDSPVDVRRQEE